MRPLSVSIDCSAIPKNVGGVGRYVTGLLGAMAARHDIELTAFAVTGDAPRWQEANARMTVRDRAPAATARRIVWEQACLPGHLRRSQPAVHHGPHYTMPLRGAIPAVVTIHDLTFFSHPEWHQRGKVIFFRRAITYALRHARVLICVSESTAQHLEAVGTPAGQVIVAPHGVDHARFTPLAPPGHDDNSVLRRLGVRPPFVAFLGTVEPRKDVPTLVRAWDRISGQYPDLSLVLAGGAGWGEGQVAAAVRSSRRPSGVLRLGYVPDADIPALLRSATAVAYPSLEEGFGLPVIEALACGAPTVTTRGTAMEEAAGGAALLVTPGNAEELAGALEAFAQGGQPAQRRQQGIEAAASHTWERSAAQHARAYQLAASA